MTAPIDDDVRQFLEGRRFAVVATTNPDGTPQPTPVWYELQGDEIMMNTRRGRKKERNVRRDPRIAVCIEDEYRWVTASGTAVIIDDRETTQADIRRLAIRYDGLESAERQMREEFSRQERVTWRLRIEKLVGEGFASIDPYVGNKGTARRR